MTEFKVTIALKPVEVSAATPAEAITKASQQITADLAANTEWAQASQLDRITVPGFTGTKK